MATGKTRPWRCPHCRAQLGTIHYQRGAPPALHPEWAVCCLVRGGVVSFLCPECYQVVEWRERRPAV
jgi:predicted RNA-binding Zn-ribbon protein involved in translation (DUF1610 family)